MEAKILIVDDDTSIRKLLVSYLKDTGYQCHAVATASAAREALATTPFDLLLSDLKMPGESGLELIKHAKKHYPHIGRVMITGFGSPEIASEIMSVGVYGYIIKPLTKNTVLITVENALRHLRLDLHLKAYKKELEARLSHRTEELTAIMNSLNVGIVMVNREMKVVELNRTMQLWFPEMVPGKVQQCPLQAGGQGALPLEQCPLSKTLQTGKSSETVTTLTTAIGEREFRIVSSPIFDRAGKVSAGICMYDDCTERKRLEKNLRQAQKLEAVGQLAAGIAHEINSPIQYLGDNINFLTDSCKDLDKILKTCLLLQDIPDGQTLPVTTIEQLRNDIRGTDLAYLLEEIPHALHQSADGVKRVEKIVRAMKDFSHPGNDSKTAVNVNEVLESTITVSRNEWKYLAEMETDFAADLPLIPGFAGELSQVFLNIIVNGAHAIGDVTEGGSKGLGKIIIRTAKIPTGVRVTISDTGGGIPKAIQDQVFDPFFTTKERGKGTGQGLSIARQVIADRHKGTLFFASETDRGTTFTIELPENPVD